MTFGHVFYGSNRLWNFSTRPGNRFFFHGSTPPPLFPFLFFGSNILSERKFWRPWKLIVNILIGLNKSYYTTLPMGNSCLNVQNSNQAMRGNEITITFGNLKWWSPRSQHHDYSRTRQRRRSFQINWPNKLFLSYCCKKSSNRSLPIGEKECPGLISSLL